MYHMFLTRDPVGRRKALEKDNGTEKIKTRLG
jgi:hypothetical protein